MRLLATQRHTVLGVQAGQALAAAKAERDVVLMGTWCAFIALGGAAIGLYVSIPLLGLRIWAMDVWAVHESALTILQWLYAILLIGLYPSLILSAWKNLSPPAHPGRFWRWFDHLAIVFPCLPSASHGDSNNANPRPRAGAAAGGRVRVIIEEHTEEAYRHDLPTTERLETIIEGGVFLDHSKEADASELGVRGGDGIGVEWIKPSWAAEGGALRLPEGEGGTGRSREARVSSLRWDDSLGTAPIESTAAQHVTPWAWYDRRPSA